MIKYLRKRTEIFKKQPPDCPLNNKLAVKSVYLTHKTVLDRLTVFILQEIQIQHHQARGDERRS